ncbi:MAG: hypothetical protein U9R16_03940 [Campylobacterota bacterium]|nr:hypothetical protein [Campylobacterota bacterium]
MSKELEQFSQLFGMTPSISILDINNSCEDITKTLNRLVEPEDGKVTTLYTTNLNELRVKVKRSNYDYAVLSASFLNQEEKNLFMKIVSLGLRDSGYIIFLEEKDKQIDEIYTLLEEYDFGAISSIDIFENYQLIMGKKLHMWGMD